MVSVICLVLLPLAVAWCTWLVVDSAIMLPLRQRVLRRKGEDSPLTYLVHCTNCTAFWVSLLFTIPTIVASPLPVPITLIVVPAMAQLAPMILAFADRLALGGE